MAETWRQRHHRATREEILAVARGIMLEEGVDGLGIREVARRTGFGPASLYTYFSGKDEIVAAITAESLHELEEYLDRVPDDLTTGERLFGLCRAYLEFADENPADLACIVEAGLRGGLVGTAAGSRAGVLATRLAAALRDGRESGGFAGPSGDEDVTEAAHGLWALAHGLAVLRHAGVDGATQVAADGALRRAVEALGTASAS